MGDIGPNVFGQGGILGTGIGDPPKMPGASQSEQALANIATALYGQTQPARNYWTNLFGNMGAGTSALAPIIAPARSALESQFSAARSNLLAGTPVGGAQTRGLQNLETQRALGIGNLTSQAWQDLLNKSYGAAWNAPGQAMGGLGTSGGLAAQRQQAQLAAETGKGAGLGQLTGQLGSAAILGAMIPGGGGATAGGVAASRPK